MLVSRAADIFTGKDLKANSSKDNDLWQRCIYGYYCIVGMPVYSCTHVELFVPAGHVGLLMNSKNEYLFAQPGMHNISSVFLRTTSPPKPVLRLHTWTPATAHHLDLTLTSPSPVPSCEASSSTATERS